MITPVHKKKTAIPFLCPWRILMAGFGLFTFSQHSFAQEADSIRHEVLIDFEVRPRAELRNNYFMTSGDAKVSEFDVSRRTKLNVYYRSRKLKLYASIREILLFG